MICEHKGQWSLFTICKVETLKLSRRTSVVLQTIIRCSEHNHLISSWYFFRNLEIPLNRNMPKKSLQINYLMTSLYFTLPLSSISSSKHFQLKKILFHHFKDQQSPPRVCACQLGDQDVPGSASCAPHLSDIKCLRVYCGVILQLKGIDSFVIGSTA